MVQIASMGRIFSMWTAGDTYRHVIQSYKTVVLLFKLPASVMSFPNVTILTGWIVVFD